MDELDKVFTENRSQFDEEPLDGHFERFEEKLLMQNGKRKSRIFSSTFLKIASVLIIMLLLTDILINTNKSEPEQQAKSQPTTEIGEAAIYYTAKINNGIRQLEQLSEQGVGSEKEIFQIKKEMAEMDSLFVSLKKEYDANPNDERIINAMIEYYQTKLNIVNTIKSDLENVKQQKRKYNENSKI